jgi:hypothetical protein
MATATGGDRSLRVEHVDVWENADGVFAGSTDPDCEFIVELTGAAKKTVHDALVKFGRKTG